MNEIQNYQIDRKWYAAALLDDIEEDMGFFPKQIEDHLKGDVNLFYKSSHPVMDGLLLLGKSVLVHLFARIAQVFVTAIAGVAFVVTGIFVTARALVGDKDVQDGIDFVIGGLYLLSFGLAADGVLAATSPLEGIYEVGRVVWSRAHPTKGGEECHDYNTVFDPQYCRKS